MKRCAPADRPADLPDWYWTNGLHDAVFTLAEALEPSYGRCPYGRCLKLHLDAREAYESDLRTISLYDCELLAGELPRPGSWWLGDALRQEDGKYVLEVSWTDNAEEYSFAVRFSSAETERR